MSRKDSSFGQLLEYCEKGMTEGDEKYSHFHNLHPGAREQIMEDFLENIGYIKRTEGVQMYHEILSLTRSSELNLDQQKAVLMETVQEYLAERAPECMAYSVIHDEKDHHLHAHIVISANPVFGEKRHRLSKSDFDKAKKQAEKYVLENHPKMQQEVTIDKKARRRESKGESELKRRGGRTSKRDQLHEQLRGIFSTASSQSELETALAEHGLAMSFRNGKGAPRFGVDGSKQHYRLNTLGLETDYQRMADSFTSPNEQTQPVQDTTKNPDPKSDKKKAKSGSQKQEKPNQQKQDEKAKGPKKTPWKDDAKLRQTEALKEKEKPTIRETLSRTKDEWLKGDFSKREKDALKQKYRKQNEADAKVQPRKEQSRFENLSEDVKEFVFADFTKRDARKRQEKFRANKKQEETVKDVSQQTKSERFKEKLDEYVKGDFTNRDARKRKEKFRTDKQEPPVKDASKQTKSERFKEKVDEYVKGDFRNRDARAEKVRREESLERFQKIREASENEAQREWLREDGNNEFIQEKVEKNRELDQEDLIRAQETEKRFEQSRPNSTKSKDRGR